MVNSVVNFLPSRCLSDHSPCIVSLFVLDRSKRKPFRFINMWTNLENFYEVVQIVGNLRLEERSNSLYVTSCKVLRLSFKRNKKHFAHISKKAKLATLAVACMREKSYGSL